MKDSKIKIVKLLLVILIAIAYQSCGSDADIEPEPSIISGSGIHYQGDFYPLNRPLINRKSVNYQIGGTAIYIRLFYADELFNADDPFLSHLKRSNIDLFSFSFPALHLVTITVAPVLHYFMRKKTGYDASNIHFATTILKDFTVWAENIAVPNSVRLILYLQMKYTSNLILSDQMAK
jgi:hypothetical protein